MDKLLDRPWFLRITALVLAIILFFSIQTEEGKSVGDQVDIIHDVPVEVYYDDENLVVTGVPESVNITIEGPTNLVQTAKTLKDFTVFVDLRTMTMGAHSVRVQHENISDKLQVRIDPTLVDVVIEERITETFRVDPEMNRRLIAEDFNISNITVEPSTVEITGAKSIVESINYVKATVTGEQGIKESFEQEASVRVLDIDLNKLNVLVEPKNIIVKVEVEENSKEVPVKLKQKGAISDEVNISSLEAKPRSITIYGPSKVLDEIQEVTVDVDVSEVKKDTELTVEIKKPKGISKLSKSKITVEVKASADEASTEVEEATIDSEDEEVSTNEVENRPKIETKQFLNVQIAVNNLSEKFTTVFNNPESGSITIAVTGDVGTIDRLMKSDFSAVVDASDIKEQGEYNYPIVVNGPTDVTWVLSTPTVSFEVSTV